MVLNYMNLCLTLIVTVLHLYSSSHAEIYSAVSELEPLLKTQKRIIEDLKSYIGKEEDRLQVLRRYLQIYKEEHALAMQNVTDYIENPLNAFKLIKRLSSGLTVIEDFIKKSAENMKSILRFHKDMLYPKPQDMTGAARAISRLQKVYKLDARDIAQGVLFGVNYSSILSAEDCYELGLRLHFDKDSKKAKEWLYEAYIKYMKMTHRERRLLYFSDAKLKEVIEEIRVELKRKEHKRELYPSDEQPGWLIRNEILKTMKRYAAICRGEIGVPRTVSKRFKCWYSKKQHPFLKYAPIKTEQVYIDPDIFVFYDVLYDDEIMDLKHMSKYRLRRAQVYNVGTKSYKVAKSRVCKSTWYKDEHSPTVAGISRRVAHMTGLTVNTAEELQVINYGMAGHYDPHYDFAQINHTSFNRYEGNRIGTVLFYMSDVEQGGATVFTDLGISVNPIKGAALFWLNLHPSGMGDMETRHAACPVIKGSKWISSKWLHEGGQELKRPCTLHFQPPGYLRKLPALVKRTFG